MEANEAQNSIDVKENYIMCLDDRLLKILLKDKSSGANIIWATDMYSWRGFEFSQREPITVNLITGRRGNVIKPRTEKSRKEQKERIKKKAEVFTPSWICNLMANGFDSWFNAQNVFNTPDGLTWKKSEGKITFPEGKSWKDYVRLRVLEITCGEAPFLASRYDTVTGAWIDVNSRVGMLDRKLRVVNENTDCEDDWIKYAFEAYQSTYGFEWQGDSLLIARENLLFTFIDYYNDRFGKLPEKDILLQLANILSWNIFQMDGLKYIVPYSQEPNTEGQIDMFNLLPQQDCCGGETDDNGKPTGIYCKIKNWRAKITLDFYSLIGGNRMKFDYIIGNPPYQGDNHYQVYPDFYIESQNIGRCVELIFPTGWQAPKNANNLKRLNTPEIKEDKQIVFIDNIQNAFNGISGAEWTNIVLWKSGYDNGLQGKQKVLTNGKDAKIVHLNYDNAQIEKPQELRRMFDIVKDKSEFVSIAKITSPRKPYGLATDVIDDSKGKLGTEKYGLEPLQSTRNKETDIKIYCVGDMVRYVPVDYKLPKKTAAFSKYKVFVAYAWGNMCEKTGLGGAFSNIIIGSPNEICTESYLESGNFDDFKTAQKHAKYLMTRFLRALLYLNKFSRHSTTAWGAIPIQDYSEDFWDKSIEEIDTELMKKYGLPSDIKEFVFKNLQKKSEKNIINYSADGEK